MNRLSQCRCLTVVVVLFSLVDLCRAGSAEFHKTLLVSNAEAVRLVVDVANSDVEITYSRDREVKVTAIVRSSDQGKIDENYFRAEVSVEREGNRVSVHQLDSGENLKLQFRIDVPYRTEITSSVRHGKQDVRGVLGPVELRGTGDVSVAYVSRTATVDIERGNLNFQMVADHVSARTGSGNIYAERLAKGIHAETGDGDVKLMVVGASEAIVRSGSGRVEVGGAKESLMGITDSGDLLVKAVPHGDWNLSSKSGSIRLELPEQASFEMDASSESGKLQFERDDLPPLTTAAQQFSRKVNGGGKRIEAHTKSGDIWLR